MKWQSERRAAHNATTLSRDPLPVGAEVGNARNQGRGVICWGSRESLTVSTTAARSKTPSVWVTATVTARSRTQPRLPREPSSDATTSVLPCPGDAAVDGPKQQGHQKSSRN